MVKLHTNFGCISLELDAEKAPETVSNFLQYVKEGYFENTLFHRVISDFMIQGGGFDLDMKEKETRDSIQNEASNGLSNTIGSIAMARTGAPHSATSQFFINVADNNFLDHPGQDGWGYCVFGKVVDGMDVVNLIKAVKTTNKRIHQDVPAEPVIIEKAQII